MPSFTFVLPHWVYWGALLVFPLVAMYMVARQRRLGAPQEPILFNAYLFWLTSGFMGLHRMYLKSWWGFLYVPFFVVVLYCNGEVRDSREDVAYWGVLAVFAYYYEVLARFVFNSPTNWVHESMFLMFGMQYMISGAYAYREDQHVRVDVFYSKFSRRGKAIADVVSSIFF